MKKLVTIVLSALLVSLSASAFEWGGLVNENFKAVSVDPSVTDNIFFKQGNGVSLWANLPLARDNSWYIATQGSYKYSYNFNGYNKNGSLSNVVDLELLKLNGNVKINDLGIGLSLGRYIVMDNTTKVFVQNCDGISLKISKTYVNLGAYLGYTGLINGNTVAVLDKDGVVQSNQGNGYTSNHPYVPVSFSIDFPSFVLNQSAGVQLSGFMDADKTAYNRFYATAFIKGPVTGPMYYNFTTCFGSENFNNISDYTSLSFIFFVGNTTFKVNCEYASGQHGFFSPFRGFNSSLAYNASWNPEYSGVILPGLDFIFSLKDVCLEANGKFVLLSPDSSIVLKGVSGNAKGTVNIFSDLSFDLGLSVYHDLETMGKNNNYSASLGLALSF